MKKDTEIHTIVKEVKKRTGLDEMNSSIMAHETRIGNNVKDIARNKTSMEKFESLVENLAVAIQHIEKKES